MRDIFVGFYPNLDFFSLPLSCTSRQYKISWKSIQWEPRWRMRTGGKTGVTKLVGAFCDLYDLRLKTKWIFTSARAACRTGFMFNLSMREHFKNRMKPGAVYTGNVAVKTAFQNVTWWYRLLQRRYPLFNSWSLPNICSFSRLGFNQIPRLSWFLGASAKHLKQLLLSLCPSFPSFVSLSAWNNSGPTGQISVKFCFVNF